jgi:hypothetical protein
MKVQRFNVDKEDIMNIKGFDKDLKCRDYQFEIGETYEIKSVKEMKLCTDTVFHYCKTLKQVHDFYEVGGTNRFCEIEVLGEEISDESKCGSNRIKIVREIVGQELDELCMKVNGNTGLFNSGDRNSGYSNSGDRNSGDSNSGDSNSGDKNSGYSNSGYGNSGYRNSGDRNSGDRNSGDRNSGYSNSGYRNSGDRNSGDRNSGYSNSGDRNSGDWNNCEFSSGVFCNESPKVKIFNIETSMTMREFRNTDYYYALIEQPSLITEWVGDKLITRSYKEACAKWWEETSDRSKAIIKSMPNFDAEIFKDITGIEV